MDGICTVYVNPCVFSCFRLNPALPDLTDDDGNPVNFRRALLNKCQEEFDYGVNAMKAVAERERRAVESTDQSDEDIDDSQMTDEDRSRIETKAEKKRLDKVAADAELVARKRMLGNIIFVGQLYRFGVLIEAVMHTCIKQLLEEVCDGQSYHSYNTLLIMSIFHAD